MATIEKRTAADGSVRYRVKIRLRGEKPRHRTFKRKTDADLWAKKVESDLGHGVYVPTTADRRRTLGELIDKFIAEQLPLRAHNADRRNLVAQLGWWKLEAGHVTLDKLTPQAIASFRSTLLSRKTGRKRAAGASKATAGTPITPATANRYLAALSAVCKWAWKELGWLTSNPVLAVSKGAESQGIVRFLSDDERRALLAAARGSQDRNIHCAIVLALATGARYSTIRMRTWDDIVFDKARMRVGTMKNGEPRYVPLVPAAERALREQFERDPTKRGWVFKGARDDAPADLDLPWRAVRNAAGLIGDKHCRFHDLRHDVGSHLTMHGASLLEVAEALGHKTLAMAQRYSHQSGEHVRSTLERIAGRLEDELKKDRA
jgi:integrase